MKKTFEICTVTKQEIDLPEYFQCQTSGGAQVYCKCICGDRPCIVFVRPAPYAGQIYIETITQTNTRNLGLEPQYIAACTRETFEFYVNEVLTMINLQHHENN